MGGRRFGQYRLDALIGVGGVGEVFRAYDTHRHRSVAVKLLLGALGNDGAYQHRFRRESYIAAGLREPHIIPIHDFGEMEGRLFIDMRLVDGESIYSLLKKHGSIAPERAVYFVSQAAEALEAAHADGLVHRDIKPSNILVTGSDFAYVVDFGIAHTMGVASTVLTRSGPTILGTLGYMAPERFENRPIDGRVDVYSLTCLLYECLTGFHPFSGRDLPSLMYAHVFSPPPQPSEVNPDLPVEFDAVVAQGMAKDPNDRFDTAAKLADAARTALATVSMDTGARHPVVAGTDTRYVTTISNSTRANIADTAGILPRPSFGTTGPANRRRRLTTVTLASGAAVAVSIALATAIFSAMSRPQSGRDPETSPPFVAPTAASAGPSGMAITPVDTSGAALPYACTKFPEDFGSGSVSVTPNVHDIPPIEWVRPCG